MDINKGYVVWLEKLIDDYVNGKMTFEIFCFSYGWYCSERGELL